MIWQVAEATGWTVDYILRRVSYPALVMMMADAPRYGGGPHSPSGASRPRGRRKRTEDEIIEAFASHLRKS